MVLNQDDLLSGRVYDDGCVPTSWKIDLHWQTPAIGMTSRRTPSHLESLLHRLYEAVLGAIPLPLLAQHWQPVHGGPKHISVTHEALGAVRVMRTTGMMAEIVGMACSLCKANESTRAACTKSTSMI